MKTRSLPGWAAALSVVLAVPATAHAHIGVGHPGGFAHGFGHPLSGADHILAMVAVGIWAAQIGGRAAWAVPATFVAVMGLGGVLGMTGFPLPFFEAGIILSVLALGVLVAVAARLPLAASVAVVGVFASFHGYAHGSEMPVTASGLYYGAGFAAATVLLHLCGVGGGLLLLKGAQARLLRYAGVLIVAAGTYLALA